MARGQAKGVSDGSCIHNLSGQSLGTVWLDHMAPGDGGGKCWGLDGTGGEGDQDRQERPCRMSTRLVAGTLRGCLQSCA